MAKITAKYLVKKYKTRNPFELAKILGVLIIYEPLGQIKGYYNTAFRKKMIHINNGLTEYEQKFTAAHELGHAVLHPKSNTPFLKNQTLFSIDKLEIEANRFAVELLISDEDITEMKHLTIEQMAAYFGVHKQLIKLRLNIKN
ncbi:ImmA/IrrE family metallo-endopeptidase [Megamonas hypermegale]|uniref:ImmA/IrrE family metallo-endopeptidase n=1 Tax=Megamonas hypermegale TaxID=158847 RepID=UPI0026F319F3|nr:ImmA/IrrE family metallo-endopeptidase [Megamonas hypermegale]